MAKTWFLAVLHSLACMLVHSSVQVDNAISYFEPGVTASSYSTKFLDFMCSNMADGTFLPLPWDCNGFIRCVFNKANWTPCPHGLVLSLVHNVCTHKYDRNVCETNSKATWQKFCSMFPGHFFPDLKNCARYYDCSRVSDMRQLECIYPNLFNDKTMKCDDYRLVSCDGRPAPVSPCEYIQHHVCDNNLCLPCEERCPSCRGLPDGLNPIPKRGDYRWYLNCDKWRTVQVLKCRENEVFSVSCRQCINPQTQKRTSCPPSAGAIPQNSGKFQAKSWQK
ncbi:uncharacterized protein LOC121390292 [Gigantopelta aegis]|uniref:uncharacterized protein LOC121390292 n=1 Tax=Gigantopelta aegis TaxID=1735272 RepID=UPI001B888EC4|nr:uncharacterized protein LOC121390292 [Gigantopelta aegis]